MEITMILFLVIFSPKSEFYNNPKSPSVIANEVKQSRNYARDCHALRARNDRLK
jgi:hypothetical protein